MLLLLFPYVGCDGKKAVLVEAAPCDLRGDSAAQVCVQVVADEFRGFILPGSKQDDFTLVTATHSLFRDAPLEELLLLKSPQDFDWWSARPAEMTSRNLGGGRFAVSTRDAGEFEFELPMREDGYVFTGYEGKVRDLGIVAHSPLGGSSAVFAVAVIHSPLMPSSAADEGKGEATKDEEGPGDDDEGK